MQFEQSLVWDNFTPLFLAYWTGEKVWYKTHVLSVDKDDGTSEVYYSDDKTMMVHTGTENH